VVLNRSTPLATHDLSIVPSGLGDHSGVIGGAWLASERFIESFDRFSPLVEERAEAQPAPQQSAGSGRK
jgi:hypothetical protein